MKWMIASDIHGSSYYCQMLMQALENEQCDRMILLGDLLYHGPRNALPRDYDPPRVIQMLNEKKDMLLCVRGNCEAEVDQMVLNFPVLADYALLPLEKRLVFITHGHTFNEQHLPPLRPGDLLLHGHTHVPVYRVHDTYTYLNPGSVSIPKEGSKHSYMILENNTFLWKDLETGDTYQVFQLGDSEGSSSL